MSFLLIFGIIPPCVSHIRYREACSIYYMGEELQFSWPKLSKYKIGIWFEDLKEEKPLVEDALAKTLRLDLFQIYYTSKNLDDLTPKVECSRKWA